VSIRNILRHRAQVKRASTTVVSGMPTTTWNTILSDLPCLLDAGTQGQPEPQYTATQQTTLDRSGLLFALPTADLKPGDRVVLTRGQSGTFVIKPAPSNVSTLSGVHHREFRCEEVP
jgi:hypothetical protein